MTRTHRLWELFLIEGAAIAPDHVDRDADSIEHFLSPELVDELEARLAEKHAVPRTDSGVPLSPHELAAALATASAASTSAGQSASAGRRNRQCHGLR